MSPRANAANALQIPADALARALSRHRQGHLDQAATIYRAVLDRHPDHFDCLHLLGVISRQRGNAGEAVELITRALALRPNAAEVHGELGITLLRLGRLTEARQSFERALALKPGAAALHFHLGNLLIAEGRLDEAAESYGRALALQPDDALAHLNLGNVRKEQGRVNEAAACYQRAAVLQPDLADAHYNLGVLLQLQGRMAEACEHYRRVLAIDPNHGKAKLAMCVAQLPVIQGSESEIARHRHSYARALAQLCDDAGLPEVRRRLGDALGAAQPFFLAYQGRNDRDLQQQYGALVCSIMAERFPPAELAPPPPPHEPIRIGFISGFFWRHSNWKVPMKGWLSQLDRNRFAIYGYYLDNRQDDATETARSLCRRFVQGPLPLARWRDEILADRPHVLIYPEVGMHPVAPLLAAQRLAPVQCNSWGHPDTSGFPTLDYYLSSALMEPSDADEHYSERLVRLPNLSVYYEPVEFAPATLERRQLGLRSGATVFWCCQPLYKYLPQFDEIFARIAAAAGDCQFVFLETPKGRHVTNLFLTRLHRAFSPLALDARRYCVVLPYLSRERFQGAMARCDVYLDSIGWSGCNSTFESLSQDLPVVTMPSGLMRGRHSAAILAMMGVTDTLAKSVDDYVAIAVRLARDPAWRSEIRGKMAANKHRIWRDRSCIAALEDFLEQAVRHAPSVIGPREPGMGVVRQS